MRKFLNGVWVNYLRQATIIILTAIAAITLFYSYQEFKIIRCEANWAYSEAVKIHNQEDAGQVVSSLSNGDETANQGTPNEGTAELNLSARPSGSIEELIKKTWNNEEEAKIAIAVARAESGLRPEATNINNNGSTDYNVFQINSVHNLTEAQKKDPAENIKLAHSLWERSGWKIWCAYTNGRYLAFL
jgi:soluble lytic murein transglycosylase-like protein